MAIFQSNVLYGHFISYGHFPLWTLFHMDILPYGQFADSPYFQYLGKLGKAFSHLSTRKGFISSRKGFANHFPKLGKLLKILGKDSLQNYPGKGKGKESFQSFR